MDEGIKGEFMKKLTALLLALVLVFSLTACGGDKTENKDNGTDKQQTQTDNKQNTEKDKNEDKKNFNIPQLEDGKKVTDLEILDLKLNKKSYDVDEVIILTLTWKGTAADNAWVGIVPADIPHGDELVNDDHDIWYQYLDGMNSGEEFGVSITIDPGKYTMRVNENDDGGAELAWVEFTVK